MLEEFPDTKYALVLLVLHLFPLLPSLPNGLPTQQRAPLHTSITPSLGNGARNPFDCMVEDVVLFFSQENIYSIIVAKQQTVTLSTRAVVETIRNSGAEGVCRLLTEGTDLCDLVQVFMEDIVRYREQLGLRPQVAGGREHAVRSRQVPLLPWPEHSTPYDGSAMTEERNELSCEAIVRYFREVPPEELLVKQEFLTADER